MGSAVVVVSLLPRQKNAKKRLFHRACAKRSPHSVIRDKIDTCIDDKPCCLQPYSRFLWARRVLQCLPVPACELLYVWAGRRLAVWLSIAT